MSENISVVILTSRGPRHAYFCREIAKQYEVRGIVFDDRYRLGDRLWIFLKWKAWNPIALAKSVWLKWQMRPYEIRDRQIEESYFAAPPHQPAYPLGVDVLDSKDPNNEVTQKWIQEKSPDVLVVFGTRLIGDSILFLARWGALNLHTGLSPYYRGGQCTFWCLYEGDLEHLGVTIHHLNQKIDGGDIIFTARPKIEPQDTVRSLECKLIRLGTVKMLEAIGGLKRAGTPRIPQHERGKLYLSKMYTLEKRWELEKRLEKGWMRGLLEKQVKETVSVG